MSSHEIRPSTAITTHDLEPFRALRYEDTVDGGPTRQTVFGQAPNPRSPRSSLQLSFSSPKRSRAPSLTQSPRLDSPSKFHFFEIKRDSGIAPSFTTGTTSTTTGRASYAESQLSGITGGAARSPTLPTIVVQDEEPSENMGIRSVLSRKPKPPAPAVQVESQPVLPQRVSSFKRIDTDIPTSGADDFNLEDLTSEKLGFSNRGSLLFGGKKMNSLIAAQVDQSRPPIPSGRATETPREEHLAGDQEHAVPTPEPSTPKKQALVTGRRKPSVHMLQAALNGGRVLSAEEVTFSLRVRNMYDYGTESAADWNMPIGQSMPGRGTPETFARDASSPDLAGNTLFTDKGRATDGSSTLRSSPTNVRASYYSRQAQESAGGIEDWEDIHGQDVDRYGFIVPRQSESRASKYSTAGGHGLQRIATSLRVEAEQPRREHRLLRMPSSARSSTTSVPPSRDSKYRSGPGSIRSFRSNPTTSRAPRAFRSKEKRILDEASDMLTVPPGLEDIAEQDDAGRSASLLKQREWAREQKWLRMAHTIQSRTSGAKGGGMRFEFDTTDPKLAERTWKGIPDRWRATAWHSFLSTSAKRRGSPASDEELTGQFHKLQEMSSADDVQIDVDVPRTVNMHVMFRRRYRGGQRLLFRVLHAISLYFPHVGYVQGMASLAATLLCYFEEENTFVMMVRLWQLRGLEQLFAPGFPGLMAALADFEKDWIGGGDVAGKLDELAITSTTYGTRWYLMLFNMSIPFPAQLRVWDVFMLLGDATSTSSSTAAPTAAPSGTVAGRPVSAAGAERAKAAVPSTASDAFGGADLDILHATSAALIDATTEIVLDSDFENAMKVLTSFIPIKDEDLLMRVVHAEWKMAKKRKAMRS